MNNIKRFMKNRKAISPIFATLILIAIAVIAGVVVYMFTSGTLATMTGGGTAAQEKVSIQAAAGQSASGGNFTVWAQCTSGGPVSITNAIIKDTNGNVLSTVAATATLNAGTLTQVTGTYAFTSGSSYTITLVSSKGGNFVSSSFTSA
jgi:archaeal type IV pilus assembly protein PilA